MARRACLAADEVIPQFSRYSMTAGGDNPPFCQPEPNRTLDRTNGLVWTHSVAISLSD